MIDRLFALLLVSLRVQVERDGCWTWLGAYRPKRRTARPQMWWKGRTATVARVVLWAKTGRSYADRDAAHLCDNPSCVNPGHLTWMSKIKNVKADVAKRGGVGRRRAA